MLLRPSSSREPLHSNFILVQAISRSAKSALLLALFVFLSSTVDAADKQLRISVPKRSHPTPVQKYNQDGVKDLNKQKIEAAKKEFYKAYLLDPNDPFTLNNLGYIAELEGDLDRALRYYDLAAANGSQAVVDLASNKQAQGRPISEVAGKAQGGALEVNRLNVQAIGLLQHDRAMEAAATLQQALKLEPQNPFTLNNLGYTLEKQGETESALKYYQQAAATHSDEKIIVTVNSQKNWRGRKISDVADANANKLRKVLAGSEPLQDKVARLNLRGVTALRRNDRVAARAYFLEASKLNPNDAFSLNNMGYVSELDGDRETANYYYAKAQQADRSNVKVGVATQKDAEGKPLQRVADNNQTTVDASMERELALKRQDRSKQPPALVRRTPSQTPPTAPPQ